MQDTLSLVVTDSGLGGLSVVAGLAKALSENSPCPKVNITYFNAWPSLECPYGVMPSQQAKTTVFNSALNGTKAFDPDKVIVACNTLSVLYHDTEFSKSGIDVIDIVNFGVNDIFEKLEEHPNSKILIAGTPTTVDSDAHRQALIKKGISEERIITQHYGRLAEKIEVNPSSAEVETLIQEFSQEASQKLNLEPGTKLFVALCCTHYGYSMDNFQKTLDSLTGQPVEILNPNSSMSKGCIEKNQASCTDASINIRVVSRIKIAPEKLEAINQIIAKESQPTAEALKNYELNENLFEFNQSMLH